MVAFALRRGLHALGVVWGVSLLAFVMLHLTPGDPVAIMLGERATPEDVIRLRRQLGLDRPVHLQYMDYLGRLLRGDLGRSIRSGQPVAVEIGRRLPYTVQLAAAAAGLALVVGVPAGTLAATVGRRWLDLGVMAFALVGLSMPTFWSGLLLILLFGLTLKLLPVTEASDWRGLVLPAVTLALPAAAVLARMTRAGLREVLQQDYIRTARAKGLSGLQVLTVHALRNAMVPVVTIFGLQVGGLLAGSVIVESVFARPGLGRLAVEAILARDFPVVQSLVLLAGLTYVLVNTAVDLAYGLLDPRIRVG